MTSSSDASQLPDRRRRREILRRTRMGLHEDLDDLRDELNSDYQRFHRQFTTCHKDLPDWLDIPASELKAPFCLDDPPALQDCLVGPHAVASIATEFESLLHTWLGEEGTDTIPLWDGDNSDDGLADELSSFETMLLRADDEVQQRTEDGPEGLEQILESIVFELEDRRETDVEALESLIQDGSIDAGRNARREIAELWEEQRRRVDHLQSIWDDLLNLHHRGVSSTLDGLDEFRQFLHRLVDGLVGAGSLDHSPLSQANPSSTDDEPGPTQPIDTEFLRDQTSSPSGDDQPATTPDIADTALMGQAPSDAGLTEPMDAGPTDISTAIAPESDSPPPTDEPSTLTEQPEPEPPQNIEPSSPTQTDSHDDFDDTDPPLPNPEESPGGPTSWRSTSPPTDPDITTDPDPPPSNPDVDEHAPPRLRLRLHRQRTGWDEVGTDEILAAFGPPAIFLGVLLLMGILSLFDLAPNPMEWWADTLPGEALPAALGALLLLGLIPWVLRWRPMWHDLRFRWIRRDELIDDVDLKLSASDRLTVDRTSWDIDQLRSISLRRWSDENAPGDQRGWLLTINPPYHDPIHLIADIDNQTRWGQSHTPTVDRPDGAWHCPPAEFHALADHLDATA